MIQQYLDHPKQTVQFNFLKKNKQKSVEKIIPLQQKIAITKVIPLTPSQLHRHLKSMQKIKNKGKRTEKIEEKSPKTINNSVKSKYLNQKPKNQLIPQNKKLRDFKDQIQKLRRRQKEIQQELAYQPTLQTFNSSKKTKKVKQIVKNLQPTFKRPQFRQLIDPQVSKLELQKVNQLKEIDLKMVGIDFGFQIFLFNGNQFFQNWKRAGLDRILIKQSLKGEFIVKQYDDCTCRQKPGCYQLWNLKQGGKLLFYSNGEASLSFKEIKITFSKGSTTTILKFMKAICTFQQLTLHFKQHPLYEKQVYNRDTKDLTSWLTDGSVQKLNKLGELARIANGISCTSRADGSKQWQFSKGCKCFTFSQMKDSQFSLIP